MLHYLKRWVIIKEHYRDKYCTISKLQWYTITNFRACADSGYQALFSPSTQKRKREPGTRLIYIICMFVMGNVHTVMLYMLLMRRDYSNLHIYSTTALCEMSSIVCNVMNDINTVV